MEVSRASFSFSETTTSLFRPARSSRDSEGLVVASFEESGSRASTLPGEDASSDAPPETDKGAPFVAATPALSCPSSPSSRDDGSSFSVSVSVSVSSSDASEVSSPSWDSSFSAVSERIPPFPSPRTVSRTRRAAACDSRRAFSSASSRARASASSFSFSRKKLSSFSRRIASTSRASASIASISSLSVCVASLPCTRSRDNVQKWNDP